MTVGAGAGAAGPAIRLPGGWHLDHRASVDSTNEVAKTLAEAGAAHGTILLADQQTAGRGRHGRGWTSPPGNFYASIVLRPMAPVRDWPQIGFVAGLALIEAVLAVAPDVDCRLKWPNDILVGDRKLAGLLLESTGEALIVGSGLNIASAPDDPDRPAIDLAALDHGDISPAELLEVYATGLEAGLDRWQTAGFAAIRALWLDRARALGQPIRVRLPGGELTGRFADLDATGALILEDRHGGLRTITAGDVFPMEAACS